jgi:hypothetical protein
MKISVQIALTLAVIVIMGIITVIKITTQVGAFPTAYVIIWLVVSIVLSGMTIRAWLKDKKK